MISLLGTLFEKEEKAFDIITNIRNQYTLFTKFIAQKNTKKVAYLIWQKPFMVAGAHTFINNLLSINKFENIVKTSCFKIPRTGYRRSKTGRSYFTVIRAFSIFKNASKGLRKGYPKAGAAGRWTYFSWYGSRLQNAFRYFKTLH